MLMYLFDGVGFGYTRAQYSQRYGHETFLGEMFYVGIDRSTSSFLMDSISHRHMSLHILIARVSFSEKGECNTKPKYHGRIQPLNSKPHVSTQRVLICIFAFAR